jgi:DNA primase
MLETAVRFYRNALVDAAEAAPVLEYLRGRGLTPEAMEVFELGYAPASWDATSRFLQEKGFTPQELLDGGMLTEKETGKTYDRFRKRIMFPIRDAAGKMTGFGARATDPQDLPKFLNSPQTAIFDKGRLLYGLDKARKPIRAAQQAVIVEGYMDVIALHQAGFSNVVSPMGTALTEHQLRLLKRYTRRIVLALDADAAGDHATLRGLTLAREALERTPDPVFDARGLVRHEGRLDAEIRVVSLPPGKDPDEVVADQPQDWSVLVAGARPVVSYVLEVLSQGRDLEDAKVKAEIARAVLPLIEDVPDPVERETYRQNLARRLKVDERALLGQRATTPARSRTRAGAGVPAPSLPEKSAPAIPASKLERFCLGMLLQDPEHVYRLDRELQELGLQRLSPQDFSGTEYQVIFQTLKDGLNQDEVEPAQFWRKALPEHLLEDAESMVTEIETLGTIVRLDAQLPRVAEEIVSRFMMLRLRALESLTGHLRFQLEAAQEPSETAPESGTREVAELMRELQRLAAARAKLEQGLGKKQGLTHPTLVPTET